MDPLTVLIIAGSALTYREMNRKDYGILTPSREERYRNAMEFCYDPDLLREEARIFNEYGLKAQAALLTRRAEWRARSTETKKAHDEVYQKALTSTNIEGILRVAQAFEGWTATKKAQALRARAEELRNEGMRETVASAVSSVESAEPEVKKSNGRSHQPLDD
jgi:hypothetical protein